MFSHMKNLTMCNLLRSKEWRRRRRRAVPKSLRSEEQSK